jgi:uncharacterized coiled-coil DUF342 family protein
MKKEHRHSKEYIEKIKGYPPSFLESVTKLNEVIDYINQQPELNERIKALSDVVQSLLNDRSPKESESKEFNLLSKRIDNMYKNMAELKYEIQDIKPESKEVPFRVGGVYEINDNGKKKIGILKQKDSSDKIYRLLDIDLNVWICSVDIKGIFEMLDKYDWYIYIGQLSDYLKGLK